MSDRVEVTVNLPSSEYGSMGTLILSVPAGLPTIVDATLEIQHQLNNLVAEIYRLADYGVQATLQLPDNWVPVIPIGKQFGVEGRGNTFEPIMPFGGTTYFVEHLRAGAVELYGPVPGKGFSSPDAAKGHAARISPERKRK